jgi:aldehyde dehydrogenase (NAD+)
MHQYIGFEPNVAAGALYDYAGLIVHNRGESSVVQDGYLNLVIHQPFGVVGAIIPWNVPIIMFCAKVGAAVATGNTVVLKSSEKAPLTSIKLASLIQEAGFPPGVINVLAGFGVPAGKAIAEHMDIRKISFTGSGRTGRLIQEMSAKSNLKNVTLELGGKTPAIIFDDADLSVAVPATQYSIQWNSGQICMANSRIYVHEKIADQFKEEFKKVFTAAKIGDPLSKETNHGPQADKIQFNIVSKYIETGKKEANLLVGGERHGEKGFFVKPTVFTDAPEHSTIVKEEIFGPVVVINTFKTEEEAIAKANDSEYGLYASVFTKDIDRAIRVMKALESGTVSVNCASPSGAAGFPFGGYKASGVGREGGLYSMKTFSETKTVIIKVSDYAQSSVGTLA